MQKFKFLNGWLDEIYITFGNYCMCLDDIQKGERICECFRRTQNGLVGAKWKPGEVEGSQAPDINLELEMFRRGEIALELINAVFHEGLKVKKRETKYKSHCNNDLVK